MAENSRTFILTASLCCIFSIPLRADDISVRTRQGSDGVASPVLRIEDWSPATQSPDAAPIPGGSREATVLWHRHFEDAIYTSTGISDPAGLVLAGTYWMPPKHVEATPLAGDGATDWTYGGTEPYVDASRNSEVLAAIDFNDTDSSATIMEWRPGSPTPLWSYAVHPCRTMVYQGWSCRKPIQVSDDGSTIAIAIVMYTPQGHRGRLFVFDAGNGTPAIDYDFPTGNVVSLDVTPHGEYIAMAGWPNVYVYDRYGGSLRWSGSIQSGNDALAISGDGNYLAWGWSTFYLKKWNGTTYASHWTHTPGSGTYVGQCAISADESTLAVSWDNGNTTPNEVMLELYGLPSLDLLWRYDYAGSRRSDLASDALLCEGPPRDHVDVPSQMLFAPDGEHLAVASWGGTFPEIHVFDRSDPRPIFTLDTPGSMFDIDVVAAAGGDTYVAACGKKVHAGQSGRGGDLYAIEIPGPAAGLTDAFPIPIRRGLTAVSPNPFHAQILITYFLPSPGHVCLTVHDLEGRLLRKLVDRIEPAGLHHAIWSGRNEGEVRMPSGVYRVRLQSETEVSSRVIVAVR